MTGKAERRTHVRNDGVMKDMKRRGGRGDEGMEKVRGRSLVCLEHDEETGSLEWDVSGRRGR